MSPEEVTELSPEEQVYFFLLEQHLMGIPDLGPVSTDWVELPDPEGPYGPWVIALRCLLLAAALLVPWSAGAVIIYVILT